MSQQRSSPPPQSGPAAPAEPAWLAAHAARVRVLQPGLRVHADDAIDALDATVQGHCAPGLHLVFLLEGGLDIAYGERRVLMRTAADDGCVQAAHGGARRAGGQPRCVMVNATEPESFSRRVRHGGYARRLSLCMSHDWLHQLQAASGTRMPAALEALLSGHLALRDWQPSARAVALAEQVLHPPACAPMMELLYQDSRLLDLLAEALAPLQAGEPAARPGPAPNAALARRLRDLREFLGSAAADTLSLDDITRHAGMNANTLQRHFRRAYGTTVFDFMRESRLQRARTALERDGISIKQAAALAGYGSAANFATAFGRRFDMAPKEARRAAQR
ncbi:helix-turn-helix transcriptional regulator [Verminephrobacter aporrectodeae]|uniref:helix-turn-helix transcriptional regulator n=1 Tax=Verminephrobacter aporrectodeae TaxID=1110389 RepID=UPI00224484ED|nr:AraC family transcriptional regulator [Verminephrobacter aporrectodeae]MCW8176482.1 AraC family transcriptional regulator [Verminephrobacter aporrectodeae subsp. tuberculatae]MCW8204169.1 AraC family transcriptional regulator [Verminephrobacter aporrectodeae subsp. tuberculatae]